MEPANAPTVVPPHQQAVDDVVAVHRTHAKHGLQEAEAESRLARDGPNELTAEEPVASWRKFLAQFEDVLVLLLLVATALSAVLWLVERESALPYEAMAILAVVLLNAVMGYLQESRAEAAVAALRDMAAARAHVVRGGERRVVRSPSVVPARAGESSRENPSRTPRKLPEPSVELPAVVTSRDLYPPDEDRVAAARWPNEMYHRKRSS